MISQAIEFFHTAHLNFQCREKRLFSKFIPKNFNTGLEIFEAREHEEQLSFLPLCHILERSVSVMFPLKTGAVVNFAESIDTVPENIREVSPTVFVAVPRIWEKFYSSITILMKDATFVGRYFYNLSINTGAKYKEYFIRL